MPSWSSVCGDQPCPLSLRYPTTPLVKGYESANHRIPYAYQISFDNRSYLLDRTCLTRHAVVCRGVVINLRPCCWLVEMPPHNVGGWELRRQSSTCAVIHCLNSFQTFEQERVQLEVQKHMCILKLRLPLFLQAPSLRSSCEIFGPRPLRFERQQWREKRCWQKTSGRQKRRHRHTSRCRHSLSGLEFLSSFVCVTLLNDSWTKKYTCNIDSLFFSVVNCSCLVHSVQTKCICFRRVWALLDITLS